MDDPKKKAGSWLLEHLPAAAADATRVDNRPHGPAPRSIGAALPGNLPLPAAEPRETRESWLMSHLADALPILGDARAVQAGHEAAQQGHPLIGAATALAGVVPLGGRFAKKVLPRIARAAIELPDGSIHWGINHAASIDAARRAGALPDWRSPKFAKILEGAREGFVDETGTFLTRDQTTQRLKDLGKKIGGEGFSSEELHFMPAKTREKFVVPDYELPHRGERPFGDSFKADSIPETLVGVAMRKRGTNKVFSINGFEGGHWAVWDKIQKETDVAPDMRDALFADGFITNTGRFVDRTEATAIARARQHFNGYAPRSDGGLTSEATVAARTGTDDAQRILKRFQKQSGTKNLPRVTAVSEPHAKKMAQIYESLPKHDPEAQAAYDALNAEVEKQHQAILGAGHTIEYVDHDPYKSSKEMIADVRDNKRLKVFKTPRPEGRAAFQTADGRIFRGHTHFGAWDKAVKEGAIPDDALIFSPEQDALGIRDGFVSPDGRTFMTRDETLGSEGFQDALDAPEDQSGFHPYMTPEQNDKFRAVHDWLAHAGEGHSFGPVGEENAYRVHSSTLSPLAQRALATETRGQNSWVNFGPHAHLPASKRPFAEQKAALWPAEWTGDYSEMPALPSFDAKLRSMLGGSE